MELVRIGKDSSINIKDIPSVDAARFELPESAFLDPINNTKVIGGIFYDKSIKFIRGEEHQQTSGLDNVQIYQVKSNSNSKKGGGDGGMSDLERRVENLEHLTRTMQEQLTDIKQQVFLTNTKLDNTVTKVDLLQMQTTITQSIQDAIKPLPNENDVKVLFDEGIRAKEIPNETKVENLVNKSARKLIIWIIGTGLTTLSATAAIIRLFIK
jgi:hypothetical protein